MECQPILTLALVSRVGPGATDGAAMVGADTGVMEAMEATATVDTVVGAMAGAMVGEVTTVATVEAMEATTSAETKFKTLK